MLDPDSTIHTTHDNSIGDNSIHDNSLDYQSMGLQRETTETSTIHSQEGPSDASVLSVGDEAVRDWDDAFVNPEPDEGDGEAESEAEEAGESADEGEAEDVGAVHHTVPLRLGCVAHQLNCAAKAAAKSDREYSVSQSATSHALQ